jgi:hypothetical protein
MLSMTSFSRRKLVIADEYRSQMNIHVHIMYFNHRKAINTVIQQDQHSIPSELHLEKIYLSKDDAEKIARHVHREIQSFPSYKHQEVKGTK